MLGRMVEDVFDDSNRLGRIVLDAFALRQDVPSREIEIEHGRRVQLSLDFISERGAPIGALLTVRDAESVRRIENEIELSRRLAAIGRLTSGVAHEVKNPINAIVIHLEILRERILQLDPETRRHMDIINSEIHRLDRVVKTLVDFSRPVELKLTRARSALPGRRGGCPRRTRSPLPSTLKSCRISANSRSPCAWIPTS